MRNSQPTEAPPFLVFGMTLYNNSKYLGAALDSLANQSYLDFAVVMLDDGSVDGTDLIAQQKQAIDHRFSYHRSPTRLGLIGSWRKSFEIAQLLYPKMVYFAWASDHDLWDRDWAAKLIDTLEHEPAAVMAYPLAQRIDECGEFIEHDPKKGIFSTKLCANTLDRFRSTTLLRRNFGNMVYGIMRADSLHKAGVFRDVLVPDRLLMQELSLQGHLLQIEEVLWFRRFKKVVSVQSQRRSLWAYHPPPSSWLPWEVIHTSHLINSIWDYRDHGVSLTDAISMVGVQALFCWNRLKSLTLSLLPLRRLRRGVSRVSGLVRRVSRP